MDNILKSSIDYQQLFEHLDTPYIVFGADDPTFTILEENLAHAKTSMVNREEIIGKPLFEVYPDTSEEYRQTGTSQLIESIRKVIRTGKPDKLPRLNYDLRDRSGKFIRMYWSVSHHPVLDYKSEEVLAVYQVTEDITEKVLAEQRLEYTEYQLKQALLNSAVGTWFWDIPGKKVFADDNFARTFGLSPQAAEAGMPTSAFIESIHPGDRKRVSNEVKRALTSDKTYESEYRTIDYKGDVRWLMARGQLERDHNGKPLSFPGVVIDITERKNAENSLNFLTQASIQFSASLDYKKTLNNIASMAVPTIADWCAIEILDDEGVLQQVAVAHKDPKKVAWAKQLRAAQGPPDLTSSGGVADVMRTGKPEMYPVITDEMLVMAARNKKELKLVRDLGMSSVIMAPLKLDGKTIGVITLVSTESQVHFKPIDLEVAKGLANRASLAFYNASLYQAARYELRAREKLQKQLQRNNIQLEKRVAERTKQLEVTNKGLEKEIAKRQKTEEVLQEYGKNLARSNQELQDFAYVASHDLQEPLRKIQAFGDLLVSEYGEVLGEGTEYLQRMRNAASRMSTLIEDLLAFSRVTTKARPPIRVNLKTIVTEVVGDLESRIKDTKGVVKVGSLPSVKADPTQMRQLFQNLISNGLKFHKPDTAPIVSVSAKTKDNYLEIIVKDNGIGFDEKYLDRIFSVFQRLHGREAYEGTGIGLAVCRKIVERYGGSITATSKKNEGSTFIVQLPKDGKGVKK